MSEPVQDDVEQAKEAMRRRVQAAPVDNVQTLSTGCTLVNLAMNGKTRGGFLKGSYYLFVGDSDSGKTWLGMSGFAEAATNPNFDDYRFIFHDGEKGAKMDLEAFFGKAVADRIEPPRGTRENPDHPGTVEGFFYALSDAVKDGRPFIYILDSIDVLDCEADLKKFEKDKIISEKKAGRVSTSRYDDVEDAKGSYGVAKAKYISTHLRDPVVNGLPKTGSILVIINQSRDNLTGYGKSRAGGRALVFYATVQLWTSIEEKIKKVIKEKELVVGTLVKVHVKRSRVTGRDRTVEVPILNYLGIDDIGGNIDYLCDWKHWKRGKGTVAAPEFDFDGTRKALIQKIEEEDLEADLRGLVGQVWREIEDACIEERKPRY